MVDTDEAFQLASVLNTSRRLQVEGVGMFNDMEDNHDGVVCDHFSRCVGGIFLLDWKIFFCTWMMKKR